MSFTGSAHSLSSFARFFAVSGVKFPSIEATPPQILSLTVGAVLRLPHTKIAICLPISPSVSEQNISFPLSLK